MSINVLLMDVPRFDVTQSLLPPSATQDRDQEVRGLENLASLSRGALAHASGFGWPATADRLIEVYTGAMASAGSVDAARSRAGVRA